MRKIISLFSLLSCAAAVAQTQTPSEAESSTPRLPPFIKPLSPDAPKLGSEPKDLHGTWMQLNVKSEQLKTTEGTPPPYTAGAAAKQNARVAAIRRGEPLINPAALCRPPGFIWALDISYFPIRILQDEHRVTVLFERFHAVWRIALDNGRASKAEPSYMGHSVGHWEGNTLVVETTGLRDALWLDESGSFISGDARITSRITKNLPRGELEMLHTIDDPMTYTQPWTLRQRIQWRPDYLVLAEHDCEETAGSVEEAKQYGYRPE